ncbi:MAG: hypothetical protein ACRDK9_13015 [Solirubrobacterales bacterium]
MSARPGPALLLIGLALLAAGCRDSDEPEPEPRPPETAEELPKLPSGWQPHTNRPGGFAIGVPRGWKASDRRISTLVRSFDRLVAVSITPDRTDDALELPLDDFATRALLALDGFESAIEPGDPRPFGHRYEGITVKARATAAKTGIEQALELIVLRREGLAAFTVVIAGNAERDSGPARRVARRMVATLRGRPVAAPS